MAIKSLKLNTYYTQDKSGHWSPSNQSKSIYTKLFHTPCLKYHFAREPFSMPRPEPRWIRTVNTKDDIQRGHKWRVDKNNKDNYFKQKLQIASQNLFNFHTSLNDKAIHKYWLFWQYDDEQEVQWFYFDFDRHYPPNFVEQREIDEIDKRFALQVLDFIYLTQELKIKPVWVTSPNNVVQTMLQWLNNNERGVHKYGLHAYVFLEKPMKVKHLRVLLDAFIDTHGIKHVEHSWQSPHKNIRLPGQRHVELCDVYINPYNAKDIEIEVKPPVKIYGTSISENWRRFLTFDNHINQLEINVS